MAHEDFTQAQNIYLIRFGRLEPVKDLYKMKNVMKAPGEGMAKISISPI